MSYLIFQDYKKLIQQDNLSQVIGNDLAVLSGIEQAAITELKSYLVQKYDTAAEFTDTLLWNSQTIYLPGSRVYLDASPYSTTKTYAQNELALVGAGVYISSAGNTPEAFDSNKWIYLGSQFQMFYAITSTPWYNYQGTYKAGQQVYYKGRIYTAQRDNQRMFPDENIQYWGAGTPVSISTIVTNTNNWIPGDNRNSQVVNFAIDITLYHAHSRISPRNIPELRVKRYDDAIKWLKGAAQGTYITADLPLIQPRSGQRIRYGGYPKQPNQY